VNSDQHFIKRIEFDFEVEDKERAKSTQDTLSRLFRSDLQRIIEQILDEFEVEGHLLRIKNLELDLGDLSEAYLETDLMDRLREILRKKMDEIRARVTYASSYYHGNEVLIPLWSAKMEVVTYFLSHGRLPVHAAKFPGKVQDVLKELIREDAARVKSSLGPVIRKQPAIAKRVVEQFSPDVTQQIFKMFQPAYQGFIEKETRDISEKITEEYNLSKKRVRKILEEASIIYLVTNERPSFNRVDFVQNIKRFAEREVGQDLEKGFPSSEDSSTSSSLDQQYAPLIRIVKAAIAQKQILSKKAELVSLVGTLLRFHPEALKEILKQSASDKKVFRSLAEILPTETIRRFISQASPASAKGLLRVALRAIAAHGRYLSGSEAEKKFRNETYGALLQFVAKTPGPKQSGRLFSTYLKDAVEEEKIAPPQLVENWQPIVEQGTSVDEIQQIKEEEATAEEQKLAEEQKQAEAHQAEEEEETVTESSQEADPANKKASAESAEEVEEGASIDSEEEEKEISKAEEEKEEEEERQVEPSGEEEAEVSEDKKEEEKADESSEEASEDEKEGELSEEEQEALAAEKGDDKGEETENKEVDENGLEPDPEVSEETEAESFQEEPDSKEEATELVEAEAEEVAEGDTERAQLDFILYVLEQNEIPWWSKNLEETDPAKVLMALIEAKSEALTFELKQRIRQAVAPAKARMAQALLDNFGAEAFQALLTYSMPETAGFYVSMSLLLLRFHSEINPDNFLSKIREADKFQWYPIVRFYLDHLDSNPGPQEALRYTVKMLEATSTLESPEIIEALKKVVAKAVEAGEMRFFPFQTMLPSPEEDIELKSGTASSAIQYEEQAMRAIQAKREAEEHKEQETAEAEAAVEGLVEGVEGVDTPVTTSTEEEKEESASSDKTTKDRGDEETLPQTTSGKSTENGEIGEEESVVPSEEGTSIEEEKQSGEEGTQSPPLPTEVESTAEDIALAKEQAEEEKKIQESSEKDGLDLKEESELPDDEKETAAIEGVSREQAEEEERQKELTAQSMDQVQEESVPGEQEKTEAREEEQEGVEASLEKQLEQNAEEEIAKAESKASETSPDATEVLAKPGTEEVDEEDRIETESQAEETQQAEGEKKVEGKEEEETGSSEGENYNTELLVEGSETVEPSAEDQPAAGLTPEEIAAYEELAALQADQEATEAVSKAKQEKEREAGEEAIDVPTGLDEVPKPHQPLSQEVLAEVEQILADAALTTEQVVLYYLRVGSLPPKAIQLKEAALFSMIREVIVGEPRKVEAILRQQARSSSLPKRIASLPEEIYEMVIGVLVPPAQKEQFIRYARVVRNLFRITKVSMSVERIAAQTIQFLVSTNKSQLQLEIYIQSLLTFLHAETSQSKEALIDWMVEEVEKRSSHIKVTLLEVLKAIRTDYESPVDTLPEEIEALEEKKEEKVEIPVELEGKPEPETYISNAGLILFAPLLENAFRELGYTDHTGKFKTDKLRERSVHFLGHLAFEQNKMPEEEMVLCKLIAGMDLDTPLALEMALTENEIEKTSALIDLIRSKWSGMDKTTNEIFRKSWIMREGRLQKDSREDYVLRVDQKGFDILLGRFSLGIPRFEYPWTSTTMRVEWQ